MQWSDGVFHTGGGATLLVMLRSLLTPELSLSFLPVAIVAAWKTLTFAVAGLTLAVTVGFPLGVIASGSLARSNLARLTSIGSIRFVLALLRSIHELVWAWLFVVAFGISPIAGVLALAIPYSGILGRIYSEILADVPEEPLTALRSVGASEFGVLIYGRLPMALPDMVGYTFYRLECGVRSAAILSFVGIAGLGYQIQLSLDDLLFGEVWTLLLVLIAMILIIDIWSTKVRQRLVA